jgi:hypothetical protein
MMPASIDRSPVRVMRTRNEPLLFTVPPMTSSPARFWSGRDSPVIMLSLTLLSP